MADAPMARDIAPNSLSALMNSHGASAPDFTSSLSASTMWVCGEMGYAGITAGRHRATVSATARDPSICLRIDGLLTLGADDPVCLPGGGDVALGQPGREPVADRAQHRLQPQPPGQRREAAEE